MKIVNSFLVAAVFEPFLFLSDAEASEVAAIDPENEEKVRDCIRQLIVLYYSKFDEKSKSEIRNSLAYMLVSEFDGWEDLLQMNQSPLSLPSVPRKFFEWLWGEIYQCDISLPGVKSDYLVREDIHAANLIKRGE
ncbi:hypothetical protein GIY62_17335 [Burkholderia plantarii]|uniref:hypothetical protein n=1 Tax=Burkholderia plantarii TaxID=41899 RepID=UPI00272C82B3|nr:hypothetical protein [Burkholderia plantarii]WLE58849.1 hypothetical protein GIY62_17335 [Burkholderia plantarii]